MNRYAYQAINTQGEWVASEISATSVASAVVELERQGLVLQSINLIPLEQIAADAELSEFHQRLEDCIRQSAIWLPGLTAFAHEMPAGVGRREMLRLLSQVHPQMSTDAFLESTYSGALLPIMTQGLQAETASQRLHDWLAHLTQQTEMRAQRWRALIYPAFLLGLVLLMLIAASLFLVPMFKALFNDFGLRLPAPTMLVIWISDQIAVYWWRTGVITVVAISLACLLLHFWRSRALTNRLFGKLVAGSTSNLSAMATFASTVAELLSLKAPLPTALSMAGRGCQHYYYQQAADQLAADFQSGRPLPSDSTATRRLPPLLIHALQVAKDGAPNLPLLRELSRIYSERTRHRGNGIGTTLPTVAIVLIGVVAAFVCIALFMPLVSMVTSLA